MTTRWRSTLKLLFVNVLVLVALLALLEGGARLLASESQPLFADDQLRTRERPFVEPHPERGFALRPGFADDLYHIDSEGFRVGPSAPFDAPTLVALGESTTFGWRVPDDASYPAQLQALLAAQGQQVRVLNAGVPSYSSTQVLRYLQEILATQQPSMVLISILWNDIWYSTVFNWYPDLLVYQQPPLWKLWLMRHSALLRAVLLRPLPEQSELVDRFNPDAFDQYRANVRAMLELAAGRGVAVAWLEPPFAPALLPPEGLNEFHVRYTRPFLLETANRYRAAVAALAGEYGVPIIDHRLSLSNDGGPAELFLDPLHPTSEGNRILAEDVLAALQTLETLPGPSGR
jgi:lysophospholipase L1-like esterase